MSDAARATDAAREPLEARSGGFETPRHVAIIMDGNGRWAAARGLPRVEGHRRGVEALRKTVRAARELGISLSDDFFLQFGKLVAAEIRNHGFVGAAAPFRSQRSCRSAQEQRPRTHHRRARRSRSRHSLCCCEEAEDLTRNNSGLTLVVAFNYGARQEIARAARRLAQEVAAGRMTADAITPDLLTRNLDAPDVPDPDVIIRTSGEQRLSNFLAVAGGLQRTGLCADQLAGLRPRRTRRRHRRVPSARTPLRRPESPRPDRDHTSQSRRERPQAQPDAARGIGSGAGAGRIWWLAYLGGWSFLILCAARGARDSSGNGAGLLATSDPAVLAPGIVALAAALAFTGFGYATGAVAAVARHWRGCRRESLQVDRAHRRLAVRGIWAAGGVIYAGAAFLGPALLRRDAEFGFAAFLFLAVTVWATDTCAFAVGRAIGGPLLWPTGEPEQDLVGRASAVLPGGLPAERWSPMRTGWAGWRW